MTSPDPAGSSAGSSLGLSTFPINRNKPHPEQWTVPLEWNMEKRECFDTWKFDLQSQISSMDKKLHDSLVQYPQNDAERVYRSLSTAEEEAFRAYQYALLRGRMEKGVKR